MEAYWYSYDLTVEQSEALAVERFRQEHGALGRVVATLDNARMGGDGVIGRAVFVVEHRP